MLCPICPTAGWIGGCLGGYIGVNPPPHWKGRIISAVLTASLIGITAIALKYFFNISLCSGGRTNLEKAVIAGIKGLLMGIVYSIGVNYLLGRFVFTAPPEEEKVKAPDPDMPCCCKNKAK